MGPKVLLDLTFILQHWIHPTCSDCSRKIIPPETFCPCPNSFFLLTLRLALTSELLNLANVVKK